jgi:hypothetical protein
MRRLTKPYLIQRLQKPYKTEGVLNALGNPFAFGGGLVNGGLSKDTMSLLKDIWRYDYMGSAEFEFGALPKSLHEIGKYSTEGKLTSFELEVTAKVADYVYDYAKKRGDNISKNATAKIYCICHVEYVDEIKAFITSMASGEGFYLKEALNLRESICGSESHVDTVGWHDIDNHYLFFTDKEMFDKISIVFGIKEEVKN